MLSTMVHNFERVSAFSPLLVCSEHLTDIHLKTAKMIAFDDVGNSSTCATGYILCAEKTGSELFYQFCPQGFLKMVDDRTGSVPDVCFQVLCQSMSIDERFLCGYRLIID